MTYKSIKHIFFDLDHTLWDFDKNSELAFDFIFKKNKIEVELEKFIQVYTPINAHYWKLYREDKVSHEALRAARLRDSFNNLNIEITDAQIDSLCVDYIEHLPGNNYLLEGTLETLEYLQKNYRLHIITNGFRTVQERKLQGSGLLKYFTTVTTSDDAGVKKPHALIFQTALEKAGAVKAESLMIGDNLEADILGAHNFGMQAILYNYYQKGFSPEYHQILKMKELADIL